MTHLLTRRRFLGITAAAAGLSLIPFGRQARAEKLLVSWQGTALGASAVLQIHHADRAAAQRLIERSVTELHRLEQLFSLYRQDSAISALNRTGVLEAPAADFVALLEVCRHYHTLSGGAFDPTVQPLWQLYASHFTAPRADPNGPPQADVQRALGKIGFADVLVSRDRIALPRRGMGLTLNGIAQGFITDRVVEILRDGGITQSLVDMGECRVLGSGPDDRPWHAGIADPADPSRVMAKLPLADQAIATSGGYGFRFDAAGRFDHLLDPRTGSSARLYDSVSVVLPTATAADALSTVFSLMTPSEIASTLAQQGPGQVFVLRAGDLTQISA